MPIYEFACKKCDTAFEVIRSVAKIDDPAPCPSCKSKRTSRKVSLFAVGRGAEPDLWASDDIDPADMGGDFGGDDFGGMGDMGGMGMGGDDFDF